MSRPGRASDRPVLTLLLLYCLAGDMRRHMTRFDEENFKHNMALVDAVKVIAEKKGATPGQLAIAWVISRGPHVVPIPGSS